MKDEAKTKVELIKELKFLRKEREKDAFKDITERTQVEKGLKDSEDRLKILFDYAPDAYYINDLKGNFIDGNKAAERLVGYKKEELIGKSFLKLKLLSTNDMLKAAKVLAKNIMGQQTGPDEFVLNRKDNSKVTVEISNYPIKIKGETLVLGIARDITERKRVEEEARQKTEDMALINTLNDAVNRGKSFLEILQLLTRETKRILFCHGATAYLVSENREYLVMQIFTRPPTMIRRIEKLIGMKIPAISIPLKAGSLYRKILQEGKPQLINNPKNIQGLMAEFTENKIVKKLVPKIYSILDTRSVINVPLVSKGKAIGLLDVSRKEPFTEFDLKRFETISGQLTSITERKQAEEKIKHLNLVLRAIRSVNQLIVKEKNRESLLKGACNNLIETRGYYSAWIALLNENGKLETYAEAGIGKAFLPIVEMLKKGELTVCGNKALKQQEVVTIKDPASTCPKCPLAQEHYGRRAMTIRLEYSGKVYGFVSVSIPTHITVDQKEQSLFKEVAGDIAFSLHNIELVEERKQAEQKLKTTYQKLKKTMDAAIDTMSKIIEAKDPYTSGHQHRVCQLAVPLARELGLSEDKVEGIRIASLIHDIGKIGLPTEILSKPGKLTDIEFSLIKGHSQVGYDILKSIDFSYPIAQIVLQHHERLDGSGYPNKLKGNKIILEAKIIGVADVVEAMSSFRPYRPTKGIDAALEEISQNKGTLYDPEVVDACLKLFQEKDFKFESQ